MAEVFELGRALVQDILDIIETRIEVFNSHKVTAAAAPVSAPHRTFQALSDGTIESCRRYQISA